MIAAFAASLLLPSLLSLGGGPPPKGKVLEQIVTDYLTADETHRAQMRVRYDDELAPLVEGKDLDKLRAEMLKLACGIGPHVKTAQKVNFLDEAKRRGKYIAEGKLGKTVFIGLHDGDTGVGDAESAAAVIGGGGWFWLYPEVLEKTRYAWTESGSEELVMDVIDAVKRTGKVDPNRIYLTGISMGGYGAWTLGAHLADMFAGAAAFAGAPSPILRPEDQQVTGLADGIIPNLYNLPLHVYQSADDPKVPVATNRFASQELLRWRGQHPGGYELKYVEVNGRGHGPPEDGYLPALQWLATHERKARPKTILWQPVLEWKKQFYWLYWAKPRRGALLQVEAKDENLIEVTVLTDPKECSGLTLLLGAPIVDLSRDVTVMVNGRRRFQGKVPRTFSTLLLTLPRNDAPLLFDARLDL